MATQASPFLAFPCKCALQGIGTSIRNSRCLPSLGGLVEDRPLAKDTALPPSHKIPVLWSEAPCSSRSPSRTAMHISRAYKSQPPMAMPTDALWL